jgi:hypothetical protein
MTLEVNRFSMTRDVWTPVTTPAEDEDATQEVRVRVADLSITESTHTGYWILDWILNTEYWTGNWKFETEYENISL